ncbi:DUF1127 domain-containing protein [Enterobacter cloacae complex sp. 2022EL-00788]|uniref:DUF1127 domain-containing protein n=1 Tax=Enterobacter cloacae complex sp. 2022EL-00788 TaxID=2996512 RepID=UPI002271574E|nr:DUF1127 domain-containing protein [Enterobacter cloacae complex sp. 2022EL-00788]MCY0773706.1 DUF1127 domain-containing protein [Enterobacter cloacae complex sp. 2022EL-00788]
MEFNENRARQPFIAFVWIAKMLRNWYRINRTRRILSQMSDEQLKDVGLSRHDV